MKRFIMVFLFMLASSLVAQNSLKNNSDANKNFTKILVSVNAQSKVENKADIFDSELLLELGKLKNLKYLKIGSSENYNEITLKLNFENIDTFYRWYNDKKIRNLLNKIKGEMGRYKMEIEYIKG